MKLTARVAILSLILACSLWAATMSLQQIPFKTIDGKPSSLKAYDGKVVLVVNVASECGLTPQYKALEAIYQKYKDKGFVVLGFPSNDFGGQEPGTSEQIKEFCSTKYKVTFPLAEKVAVKSGKDQHPLYTALTGKDSPHPGEVTWNFGKFLINRKGTLITRFDPEVEPDAEKVIAAIEKALAEK